MTKVDCTKCVNRGRAIPGAEESYCENCIHCGEWRHNYYDEGPAGGVKNANCDGCASGWPVRDGIHRRPCGRAGVLCTANIYKGEDK